MEYVIKAGGIFNIAFVLFHFLFWRIFNWKDDLSSLSFLNRAIMQVLNLSLSFAFVIFSYISLVHTEELLSTPLGQSLLILMSLFWFLRAIEQVIFFKLKHWGSITFLGLFLIGALLYAVPAIYSTESAF